MGQLIALSLNLSKIDKSKLITGEKGTYANITVSVNDEEDKFGNNVSCWEGQTKEEREAKADRNFLGNGKIVWSDKGSQSSKTATKKATVHDNLPF